MASIGMVVFLFAHRNTHTNLARVSTTNNIVHNTTQHSTTQHNITHHSGRIAIPVLFVVYRDWVEALDVVLRKVCDYTTSVPAIWAALATALLCGYKTLNNGIQLVHNPAITLTDVQSYFKEFGGIFRSA